LTNKINILILSHEYPPYYFGGVGTYTKELAEYLSLRFNVYVITGRTIHDITIERKGSLNIIRVPFPDIPIRNIWYSFSAKEIALKLAEKATVILSNAASAGYLSRWLRYKSLSRKLITIFHGTIESIKVFYRHVSIIYASLGDLSYYVALPVYNSLYRSDLENTALPISIAKHVSYELITLYPDLSHKIKSGKTIYAGIDYEKLRSIYLTSHTKSLNKSKIVYAYVGRLYVTKGIIDLLQVFKLITQGFKENGELWIFGKGPMENYVRKFVKKHKLNIRMFGFVERGKLLNILANYVDVILFPSYYEGCPLTLLEANALGIPIVTWNLHWAQEFVIESLNGFKAPLGDLHMFADLAIKALNLRKNAVRIHEYASRFDRNKVFKELEDLVENIMKDKNS